jgi:Na+/proline symporter
MNDMLLFILFFGSFGVFGICGAIGGIIVGGIILKELGAILGTFFGAVVGVALWIEFLKWTALYG